MVAIDKSYTLSLWENIVREVHKVLCLIHGAPRGNVVAMVTAVVNHSQFQTFKTALDVPQGDIIVANAMRTALTKPPVSSISTHVDTACVAINYPRRVTNKFCLDMREFVPVLTLALKEGSLMHNNTELVKAFEGMHVVHALVAGW